MTARAPISPTDAAAVAGVLTAVRQAADVVCDRWALSLIFAAFLGERRFGGFVARTGAASRLAADRLRRLEAWGLFSRIPYSRRPLRWDYPLTNMGAAFRDVLAQMIRWEERWSPGAAGDLADLVAGLATDLRCRACGGLVTAQQVDLKLSRSQLSAAPEKQSQWRRSTLSGSARDQAPGQMAATLELFGDKWTIDVLICLFMRIGRFVDFRASTGISANILSDRLARLTRLGVVRPSEAGYRLTERGVDLYGVLVTIEAWADAWLNDRYSSPVRLIHRSCGARFRPLPVSVP